MAIFRGDFEKIKHLFEQGKIKINNYDINFINEIRNVCYQPRNHPFYDTSHGIVIDGEYEDITNKQFSLVQYKTTGEITGSIKINGKDITNKRALPGVDK